MKEVDDKTKIRNLEIRLRKIKRNYDAMINLKIEMEDKIRVFDKENEELKKRLGI